ncbi:MAG: nicotinate-nucleotide adenylyltransferase [Lachnospiraceae bacterium]|nr:nicotinate-nucleotide adenylyltransferase [Lachnospiraceae bacterium]
MKRIGIMGGTFNPIHNGHLTIAQRAKEQFSLDKVLFMPSGVPYMKNLREVLPASVRCEMTFLAIRNIPYFELSDLEALAEENTYTCHTLQKLKSLHPDTDYYFILGADSLYAIEEWRHPELIFQYCTILAAARAEQADDASKSLPAQRQLVKQTQYLREKYHAAIELLEISNVDISSTQIRTLLSEGKSIRGLVPEAVETYISENHLYRSKTASKGEATI